MATPQEQERELRRDKLRDARAQTRGGLQNINIDSGPIAHPYQRPDEEAEPGEPFPEDLMQQNSQGGGRRPSYLSNLASEAQSRIRRALGQNTELDDAARAQQNSRGGSQGSSSLYDRAMQARAMIRSAQGKSPDASDAWAAQRNRGGRGRGSSPTTGQSEEEQESERDREQNQDEREQSYKRQMAQRLNQARQARQNMQRVVQAVRTVQAIIAFFAATWPFWAILIGLTFVIVIILLVITSYAAALCDFATQHQSVKGALDAMLKCTRANALPAAQ